MTCTAAKYSVFMKYCRCLKHCADINSLNLHHPFNAGRQKGIQKKYSNVVIAKGVHQIQERETGSSQKHMAKRHGDNGQEGKGEITIMYQENALTERVVTHWNKLPCYEISTLAAIQGLPGKGLRQPQLTFKLHLTQNQICFDRAWMR